MTNTNRMKRFQWKWVFAAPAIALAAISCETPDPTDDPSSSYPSNDLVVDGTQNLGLTEITAVTCPDCPVRQEVMEILKARYPGRIIPMSLHADTLFTQTAADVYLTLGDDQSNPFKLFINGTQVASDPFELVDAVIQADAPPVVGVAHATREIDTAWVIYPKVEMYADNQRDLFIQSYILMDNVVAKQYGDIDLTQLSNDPRLQQGGGGAPTTWTTAAGEVDSVTNLYAQGDAYMHHDVLLYGGVNDTTAYGIPLSLVNPLGQNYFAGDIFGNEYTPMEIYVPKPDFNIIGHVGGEIKVVTIVWERFEATPPVFTYVNGYYSAF